jgi:LysR family hydrogen peroxide-inducible transcriptional activator
MPLDLIEDLQRSAIDMAIVSGNDVSDTNLLTIDLWQERFVVYAARNNRLFGQNNIRVEDLHDGQMWTLRSFHDRYPQLTEVTHQPSLYHNSLDCGSLQTLLATVEASAGYTLIPETFAQCLPAERQPGIARINTGKFFRTVTLAIRRDYMRERMLNIVTGAVRRIIPREMLMARIANFDRVKI